MNILVTGAGGYIGHALVERLCALTDLPGYGVPARITLCDVKLGELPPDPRVRGIEGSFADPAVLAAITEPAPDLVFHLACVASGRAEEQFDLGLQVNLTGSLQLLERLRQQGKSPGFVFTSSIAVFGAPLPDHVDEQTPAAPALSYGAHKLAMEILLADYTRRGFLRARTVRLPGIVPRPPAPNGAWSAFSSTLIRSLAAGQSCTMPVGPDATLWLMSRTCCIDNLLNAAWLATQAPGEKTAWTLPALHVSVREIVAAFDARGDGTASAHVCYAPEPAIEAQFGSQPPLSTPAACAAGFRHDGNLQALLDHAAQTP